MRGHLILRLLGMLMFLFSLTLFVPVIVSLIYHDGEILHFLLSILVMMLIGVATWYPVRRAAGDLRPREAFIFVSLFFWLTVIPNISLNQKD